MARTLANSRPLDERFWEKVDRRCDDECWPWRAATNGYGYGTFGLDGRVRLAHRVAWELHHGREIPSGLHACHHCDNPPCVNPAHIFIGTASDNARDAISKGRPWGPPRRTVCGKGHRLEGENAYIEPSGHVQCRQCRRESDRRRRALARFPATSPAKEQTDAGDTRCKCGHKLTDHSAAHTCSRCRCTMWRPTAKEQA